MEEYLKFSNENTKRIKIIETLYKDNVYSDMEAGVLVPIEQIDASVYDQAIGNISGLDADKMLQLICEMELKKYNLYIKLIDRLKSEPQSITKRLTKMERDL